MRMVDLIEKKRDNNELTYDELKFIIDGYVKNLIPDYQISSLLMAIYFNGMSFNEAYNLSIIMRDSGDVLDLSSIEGIKVDKHSTGGVGDKTTLVLGPMLASLGVKFAKMSGRGLGHTGGTIDKLEAIPGYNVSISEEKFIKQVNDINIAIVGQTGSVAPADKKIYALRDVTATVPSIPLIASSIMSKKLASGADAICLDVKVGRGAFMKNINDASKLASLMVEIGKKNGKKMTAILTNMQEPLGYAVGNSLEVIEAIETLKGKGPKDLEKLCVEIASYLLMDSNKASSIEEAKKMALNSLYDGSALNSLIDLVRAQGGDIDYITNTKKFKMAKYIKEVYSEEEGYVSEVDALRIGHSAMILGAGRNTLLDKISFEVGIVLNKKVGDIVKKGDLLAKLYSNTLDPIESITEVKEAYKIDKKALSPEIILKIIR